eukprot:5336719-Amphidinium_carterae.1
MEQKICTIAHTSNYNRCDFDDSNVRRPAWREGDLTCSRSMLKNFAWRVYGNKTPTDKKNISTVIAAWTFTMMALFVSTCAVHNTFQRPSLEGTASG